MRAKAQDSSIKSKSRASRLRSRAQRGFTFMELLIVMVIIAIMAAVAIPKYLVHLKRAKEVVLMQDLWAMRRAIDFYTTDKEKAPATLQDLVSERYLRDLPKDPVCPDCPWTEVAAVADSNDLGAGGGIGDVKSSAPGSDSSRTPEFPNGKPYADY